MGDSFTNFLLVVLISLLGFIGHMFYKELKEFKVKVEGILIGDMENQKDIERLKEITEDHEERITNLE